MKSNRRLFSYLICLCMVGVVVFSCKKKHIEEPVVKNSKFFLYSLEGPQLDKEKFTSFAKKLTNQSEISLDATQESYISYTNEKSGDHFSLLANGSLSFSKGIKDYLGNAKPELPSEQSVEKIAQDFLQQFSLVPQRKDELTFLHLGGVRADTPNGEVIDKMRTITYGRVVDSIPVVGSGSKIIVHVGNKGEVTGLVHRWRELSGANKKAIPISELIDEKEAAQLFKRSIEQEFGKEANVTIKSQRMVYYDGGGNYLQPAFSFESEISMESLKNTIPYLGILQALKESPEKINLLDISDNALKSLIKSDRKTESTGDRKNKD